MFNSSSIASLVVPAILETIAFLSFNRQFNKVDLPTFGAPSIATGIPFCIAFPTLKDWINFSNSFFIISRSFSKSFLFANSTSSSEKSNSNSINEANSINLFLKKFKLLENPPLSCLIAVLCAISLSEAIKSATDSA